jgi:hypothetical protein
MGEIVEKPPSAAAPPRPAYVTGSARAISRRFSFAGLLSRTALDVASSITRNLCSNYAPGVRRPSLDPHVVLPVPSPLAFYRGSIDVRDGACSPRAVAKNSTRETEKSLEGVRSLLATRDSIPGPSKLESRYSKYTGPGGGGRRGAVRKRSGRGQGTGRSGEERRTGSLTDTSAANLAGARN